MENTIFTLLELIAKANIRHNYKYSYNKVASTCSRLNVVCIICPTHGEFNQTLKSHLAGNGCNICKNEATSLRCKFTVHEFVSRANSIHHGRYDYSKVSYSSSHGLINIICPLHGEFRQKAYSHLAGIGCTKCGNKESSLKRTGNLSVFINQAKLIHNNFYLYENAIYISSKTKLHITCPHHGNFWQTPNKHLSGRGCPSCKSSSGEGSILNILENLKVNYQSQLRISECRRMYPLPFDFAILKEDGSIAGLIEFQGEQHYIPISYWGGEERLKYVQSNDSIKKSYCEGNKIPLLVISYTEDVTSLLCKFLKDISLHK